MTEKITSRKNENIINACRLKEAKARRESGKYFFEGRKLFFEAVAAKIAFDRIYITEKMLKNKEVSALLPKLSCDVFEVSDEVYEKLTAENSPEGIFCIAHANSHIFDFSLPEKSKNVLLLDNISDPGNMGAILRNACAFGSGKIYISENSVDVFSPKTIRASMGAVFKCNICVCNLENAIYSLKNNGYKAFAAVLSDKAKNINDVDFGDKYAFIIGNEGNGISKEILSSCENHVIIPMEQNSESLNAAVASGILLWEGYRR